MGTFFDRWQGSRPWGVVVGAFLGFAIGMNQTLALARAQQRPSGRERR
jgi:F0F1-type ATP synthase assembly protein I